MANLFNNLSTVFRSGSSAVMHGFGWDHDARHDAPQDARHDTPGEDRPADARPDSPARRDDGGVALLSPDHRSPNRTAALHPAAEDDLLRNHHRDAHRLHEELRGLRSNDKPVIHPLAAVHEDAVIGNGTVIGPFCVVGPDVVIGTNNRLTNNVTIVGRTVIGDHNLFHPNCVIGSDPQDKKYRGEPTRTEIGDYNCFREAVTIHAGTLQGGGITSVGDYNLLMVNAHFGHDVRWGSHTIVANNCMIAGHVIGGDGIALMGGVGVHHFTTIGDYSYIAAYAQISKDVPPFVKCDDEGNVRGLNTVGLKRHGHSEDDIEALDDMVRRLWIRRGKQPIADVRRELERTATNAYVRQVLAFLRRRDQGVNGRFMEAQRAG